MHKDVDRFTTRLAVCALGVAGLLMLVAYVSADELRDIPVVQLTIEVQLVKPDKVCAKAIAVLTKAANIVDPVAFVSIEGKMNTGKCLEAIFSELSSPTNGYKVIAVQRYVQEPQ